VAYTVNNSGSDRHKNRHNCSRLVRSQREIFPDDISDLLLPLVTDGDDLPTKR
jgi:hypothetical protein